jgi:hypothetical protein
MDMTVKRVAGAALVLAAVLLPLRTKAPADRNQSSSTRARRLDTLYWARHNARLSWSAFDLDDSARALAMPASVTGAVPPIVWRGFGHVAPSTKVDSLISDLWSRIGTTDPRVRTVVMAYDNRAYELAGYTGARLVHHGDSTDCIAIVPARTDPHEGVRVYEQELGDALAPCALLAAFGRPGDAVGNWLAATRYASAHSNRWLVQSGSRFTASPWAEWSNTEGYGDAPDGFTSTMATVGLLDISRLMRPPYDLGATGLRCISGMEDDCVTGVLRSQTDTPAANVMPANLTLTTGRSYRDTTTVGAVRPAASGFIAAIITDFGRERFRTFWKSDLPFEAAFQSAFGESLGAWTARWAARQWRSSYDARYTSADIVLGVTLKPEWIPVTIGWSVVALVIAGLVARGRRTA